MSVSWWNGKMQAIVGGVSGQLRSWGSAVSARLAHAANIGGGISGPQSWSAAATSDEPMQLRYCHDQRPSRPSRHRQMGISGGPFGQALMGALSGRGMSGLAARTPKVIPRSPAGG